MKREIKFRAWDKYLKVMITPFIDFIEFKESDNCQEMDIISTHYEDEFAPTVIMQWTGLVDDNGVEIYEGDVISNFVAEWIVVFNTGCFCAQMKGHEFKDGDMFIALRAVKGKQVIGNIYQNPYLP